MFYAAHKAFNDTCDHMNHENLKRLQEALEDDALEPMPVQFFLPKFIPHAIEKLRRHFCYPEQLFQILLDKVNQL